MNRENLAKQLSKYDKNCIIACFIDQLDFIDNESYETFEYNLFAKLAKMQTEKDYDSRNKKIDKACQTWEKSLAYKKIAFENHLKLVTDKSAKEYQEACEEEQALFKEYENLLDKIPNTNKIKPKFIDKKLERENLSLFSDSDF